MVQGGQLPAVLLIPLLLLLLLLLLEGSQAT